jgi:hypothetical protein
MFDGSSWTARHGWSGHGWSEYDQVWTSVRSHAPRQGCVEGEVRRNSQRGLFILLRLPFQGCGEWRRLSPENVRLDAHTCVCRAVRIESQIIDPCTRPSHLWAVCWWITSSILDGEFSRRNVQLGFELSMMPMVGGSITRDEQQVDHVGRVGRVSRKSPYKRDLETYLKIQREVKNASDKQGYVWALSHIVGKPLNVPVKWISEQNHLTAEETELAFREGCCDYWCQPAVERSC